MPVDALFLEDEAAERAVGTEQPAATGSEQTLEQAYMANLLARPDLLPAVQPDARTLGDPTVRAMLHVVTTHGAAYTKPVTMLAALDALPQEVSGEVANQVLMLVPEPEDVDLGLLLNLKTEVERASATRQLAVKLDRARASLGKRPADMVLAELREAVEWYDRGQIAKQDMTARGALDRLRHSPPKTRWKIGAADLDEPFPGIGPDGSASYGMCGQGEIALLVAPYGVGKTRVAQNWEARFLNQGASVAHLMLEDDETAGMTKLMGIAHDLEFWKIEQYARGELAFIGKDAAEETARLDAALAWYEALSDRIRIYDGANTTVNIFDFDAAMRLLELDVRLYKTTHLFVDYVQAFTGGGEYEHSARFAQQLRAFAGRHKIALIEISQMPNEAMKWGSAPGQVSAKGAGDWGQAAHIGIELEWDAAVGQRELCLNLKKARNAGRRRVYCSINEATGRIGSYYGTPMFMELPEPPKGKGRGARK